MSYIRAGSVYRFVDGISDDYIYASSVPKYEKSKEYETIIVDYGNLNNETIIELLFRHWETDDIEFKKYLLGNLSKRLNVKLRKNPLSFEEAYEMQEKLLEEWENNKKELFS